MDRLIGCRSRLACPRLRHSEALRRRTCYSHAPIGRPSRTPAAFPAFVIDRLTASFVPRGNYPANFIPRRGNDFGTKWKVYTIYRDKRMVQDILTPIGSASMPAT